MDHFSHLALMYPVCSPDISVLGPASILVNERTFLYAVAQSSFSWIMLIHALPSVRVLIAT